MTWSARFKTFSDHVPSILSIVRGFMGLSLPFFLFSSSLTVHLIALAVFIVGALTDYWDGWYARKYNKVTDLGKILDPTSDKFLILAPLATFSYLGMYSPWWVVPIFLREVLVTFCRLGFMLEAKAVAAEKMGKLKFVFQVFTLAVLFLEFLCERQPWAAGFEGFIAHSVPYVLMIANFLTLISGASFFISNRHHFKSLQFARYVSACGVGLIPKAPGTYGSLLALILVPFINWNTPLYVMTAAALWFAGAWAVRQFDLSSNKDPQFVVMDEVIGILITFYAIPLTWTSAIAGFCLFRFFDITKPFPLRRFEKAPGYWGIMLDDVGAGIYSWLIMQYFFLRG